MTLRDEFCDELGHFAGRGVWRAGALAEQQSLDPYEIEWIEWEDEEE